ncbi:MAG TPA: hypothetical protein VF484_02615 [Candidatus Limnocylindrales bacterium]
MTTNDRFAADLRRRLHANANERPADGQLATVVAAVAATPQRRSIVARLTWAPGRIGPLPARPLRYGLLAAALVGVLGGSALLGGGSGPSTSRTVFEGTWTTTDPADHSTMTLVVGAGSAPAVRFEDDLATGAACLNDVVKHFTAYGTATIEGFSLSVRYPNGGGCGLVSTPMSQTFDYAGATDTLSDQDHLSWIRVALGGEPGTPPPGSAATPPFPTDACFERAADTYYGASVDGVSVRITIPATGTWYGITRQFRLFRGSCVSGPLIRASLLTHVMSDTCHWDTAGVAVTSAAEAAATLSRDPAAIVKIDGLAADRVELSVPASLDTSTCDEGSVLLWRSMDGETKVKPGTNATVYLLDFRGAVLLIAIFETPSDETDTPTLRAELDSIIESLVIT